MIEIRPLSNLGWDALARAFNAAFSDYVVPMSLDAAGLEAMQRRRGYRADASFGVFDGDELVAFVLTCVDGDRTYNSGTGVVPTHRRAGHARRLIDHVIDRLAPSTYVLEVIETNTGARRLYERAGFVEVRGLQTWTLAASASTSPASGPPLGHDALEAFARHAEVEPSWQNSLASIRRASERSVVLGDDDGVVVVFPSTGDVPFLCVRPEARRRGRGRALLAAAAAVASRPLRIVNVDERHDGVAGFLEAVGATRFIRQIEMIRRA